MSHDRTFSPDSYFQTTVGHQLVPKITTGAESLPC